MGDSMCLEYRLCIIDVKAQRMKILNPLLVAFPRRVDGFPPQRDSRMPFAFACTMFPRGFGSLRKNVH